MTIIKTRCEGFKEGRDEEKKVDIFRDTPLRYLGYANEVGESFRSVVSKNVVRSSYVLASMYVLADAGSKSMATLPNENAFKTGIDVLIWQSFASVIIPGITINRICAGTKYALKRSPLRKYAPALTVTTGLASIPIIIHPIDRFVDYCMDRFVRPLLFIK